MTLRTQWRNGGTGQKLSSPSMTRTQNPEGVGGQEPGVRQGLRGVCGRPRSLQPPPILLPEDSPLGRRHFPPSPQEAPCGTQMPGSGEETTGPEEEWEDGGLRGPS